jgi:RNA polymerase sigma-54 factor
MKLSLDLRTSLTQTLTPQQIQYLKLLQMPLVQLEQQVFQEIEQNPMLEASELDDYPDYEDYTNEEPPITADSDMQISEQHEEFYEKETFSDDQHEAQYIDDKSEPFEFWNLVAQDDSDYFQKQRSSSGDSDDGDTFQIKDNITFIDELLNQLRMLELTEEEFILGEQIIGSVDTDGYLRRNLSSIVDEVNSTIMEINFFKQREYDKNLKGTNQNGNLYNPARKYALEPENFSILAKNSYLLDKDSEIITENNFQELKSVTIEDANRILDYIRNLDPPGIASRSVQECLIAQCKAIPKPNAAQKLALEILDKTYDAFTMKHYHIITKQLEVTDDYLREALEVIRRLNPKPGGGKDLNAIQTVIPDFTVTRDEESNDLIITINDSSLPHLKLNSAYEKLKKEARIKQFNKDTREWIRNKYEDAKFLIQAIKQRKSTMLKVMTAISGLQKDFFFHGPDMLKPLIYKDVSDKTGLDISTVCRIVNGKYVQSEFGIFELKYFFSESLTTEDGEDVSTTVVKKIIKEIIENENKSKPLSDDKISSDLKKIGYNVARRTVAKYREQLKIPVARLRKEL